MTARPTLDALLSAGSESFRRVQGQPGPRQARPGALDATTGRETKCARREKNAPYGACPHTGRPYRSKTEARWAAEHLAHRYEAVAIATPCGVYWVDFVAAHWKQANSVALIEVKGGWIRDRAMHKVKAAIRPARALGFAGIWLAQWKDGRWDVSEVKEG